MAETPMMQQYQTFKKQYPDKLLLYRMGDFFETFGDDAKVCAKILNITLTARSKNKDAIALAGFPHHALDQYLPKLIQAGHCVVIVDQIEDPKFAKGIVKRGVTRIVTPGTMDSDQSIKNTYLASFFKDKKKKIGCTLMDLSTGTLIYTTLAANKELVNNVINSYSPVEILVSQNEPEFVFQNTPVQFVDKSFMNNDYAKELVQEFFQTKSIEGFGLEQEDPAVNALAMILKYVQDTQRMKPDHVELPKRFNLNKTMVLDRATIANLELVAGSSSRDMKDSLFSVIDQTLTLMGRRLLYFWVLNPLIDKKEIDNRLSIVEKFVKNASTLDKVREGLNGINDIERLVGKIGLNRANGRDLKAIQASLEKIVEITASLKELKLDTSINNVDVVKKIKEIITIISDCIYDNPPTTIMEGFLIKDGYNKEVDELRNISGNSKGWLKQFEEQEKKRSGISSLKIGFNKVFGYYIEITKANQDKAPSDYIRKQTLVNGERYITEELKEKESIILNAQDKINDLEYKLFQEIRAKLLNYIPTLQLVAKEIAKIDCLTGFAYLATMKNYAKPTIYDFGEKDGMLEIKGGRHPVVENLSSEEFVSNDTKMNLTDAKMIILTGPNMSGKSTYIRQVAVITLLAQIGSYVPAKECKLSLVDRIFTRVGASDDLSRGRSTFMVEMNEAANIVNNASKYSLVILDEIGRGTSTYDGVSIAWALSEHLLAEIKCRTLFATHYHELLKLSEQYEEGIKNYNVLVEEDVEKSVVIFLRKIVEGGADRSYGIYVAKMAGLPDKVILRANEILESFEQETMFSNGPALRGDDAISKHSKSKVKKEEVASQMSLFNIENSELINALKDIDVDTLTPLEALNKVALLKKIMKS